MKPNVILLAICAMVTSANAQNFTIDWFTIDGGGGTSEGGGFTLTGTIGQTDAGFHTGGAFTLQGGFWVPFTGEVPRLFITKNGANVIIRWEPATPGYVLQQNVSLGAPGWSDAPSGAQNPVTNAIATANRFYRLRQ